MDGLNDFLNWAWARHANPLSWYIRPPFILPGTSLMGENLAGLRLGHSQNVLQLHEVI